MTEQLRKDVKEKLMNGEFNCAKELTLSIISGKYKVVILWHLGVEGPHRFFELQKLFPKISHRVLSKQLKELQEDGIIDRYVSQDTPPKVTYFMTEVGVTLLPIVQMMYEWGTNRIKQLYGNDLEIAHQCECEK
ncbi:winged helix-turn-helix transcriptional regulator [Rummeliibacillus pycnus]|uniref:winged helix-turn-helix transcriptional regulator n=1 Tax=Rummeliibacillus pycnus TaxID=101070 RepID=UPI000C9CC57E|nr:helix-turn-helix domain-containing protein [Rummeliibacillus pycnus]